MDDQFDWFRTIDRAQVWDSDQLWLRNSLSNLIRESRRYFFFGCCRHLTWYRGRIGYWSFLEIEVRVWSRALEKSSQEQNSRLMELQQRTLKQLSVLVNKFLYLLPALWIVFAVVKNTPNCTKSSKIRWIIVSGKGGFDASIRNNALS